MAGSEDYVAAALINREDKITPFIAFCAVFKMDKGLKEQQEMKFILDYKKLLNNSVFILVDKYLDIIIGDKKSVRIEIPTESITENFYKTLLKTNKLLIQIEIIVKHENYNYTYFLIGVSKLARGWVEQLKFYPKPLIPPELLQDLDESDFELAEEDELTFSEDEEDEEFTVEDQYYDEDDDDMNPWDLI